jgi:hypothetical protein
VSAHNSTSLVELSRFSDCNQDLLAAYLGKIDLSGPALEPGSSQLATQLWSYTVLQQHLVFSPVVTAWYARGKQGETLYGENGPRLLFIASTIRRPQSTLWAVLIL